MKKTDKLNVGCGADIKKEFINLDISNFEGVDVTHDLNKTPYPFKKDTFSRIVARNILEHLDNLPEVMEELFRISKPNAEITITVPYFTGLDAYTDPTHKRFFTYNTFDFFDKTKIKDTFFRNSPAEFRVVSKRIVYSTHNVLKCLNSLPNIWPKFYEKFLANILPSSGIIIKLKVLK